MGRERSLLVRSCCILLLACVVAIGVASFKTDVPFLAVVAICSMLALLIGFAAPQRKPETVALAISALPTLMQLLWLSRSYHLEQITIGYVIKLFSYLSLYTLLAYAVAYPFVILGQKFGRKLR